MFITEQDVFCKERLPFDDLPCMQRFKVIIIVMEVRQRRNQSLKQLKNLKSEKHLDEPLTERLKAPKLLPTIAENRQQTRLQAKELGIQINKFETIIDRDASETNQEELIRNAYYVIKSFGEVDNNFKGLFVNLHQRIKDYLFISEAELCKKYRIREGNTYKKSIKIVDRLNEETIKEKNELIIFLQEKLATIEQGYKQEIQRQHIEICELKDEVQRYKKMSDIEYVKSLQVKIEELKEVITTYEDQIKVLGKKGEEMGLQIVKLKQQIEDEQYAVAQHETTIYDLNLFKQKNQLCLHKLKDRFDELSGTMESLKSIIQKVQAENEVLVSERAKLVNRAAVVFDDLTPRPRYKNYFASKPQDRMISSKEVFQIMLDQLPPNKQEFYEKHFLVKRNKKLIQAESIRLKTIQNIDRANKDVENLLKF